MILADPESHLGATLPTESYIALTSALNLFITIEASPDISADANLLEDKME